MMFKVKTPNLFCHIRSSIIQGTFTIVALFSSSLSFAVINGGAANENRFNAVGALKIGDNRSVGCTATLIAPNWIVTADHCIHATDGGEEEGGNPLPPEGYEFRLGNDFKKPVSKIKIKRWVAGPEVDGQTLDIAFGELSSPAPVSDLHLSVVPAWSLKWDSTDMQSSYIHVGYGVNEAFSSRPSPLSDKRQQAMLTVTANEGNALLKLFGNSQNLGAYIEQFHPQSLEAEDLDSIIAHADLGSGYYVSAWDGRGRKNLSDIQMPSGGWQDTCFGDSGGPLLREINGQLVVVGVVSKGMDRICSPMGTKFTIFSPPVQFLMKQLGI
ncbi:hypothetical protein DOM22_02780 [Bdellovibrio sp. ZAP7]|uniref:trypsin-like serine protease n=1 Tax=Bdellovibrio sp. ZAP7 TaxID=2231053 RepID=UPI0011590903|nr:trypsin-like serine protease [Bdellovibrio sp. ZAP7]QDK44152.1 hypothetical protein DOM22_02780 [Bdellovibrio sp. ZAP7]